jgi:hypothetical protein
MQKHKYKHESRTDVSPYVIEHRLTNMYLILICSVMSGCLPKLMVVN